VVINTNRNILLTGLSEPDDIAELFARSYEDLYSSVGFSETEMTGLKETINEKVLHDDFDEHCTVKVTDVIAVVPRLKYGSCQKCVRRMVCAHFYAVVRLDCSR
jgi:hypothetical protein